MKILTYILLLMFFGCSRPQVSKEIYTIYESMLVEIQECKRLYFKKEDKLIIVMLYMGNRNKTIICSYTDSILLKGVVYTGILDKIDLISQEELDIFNTEKQKNFTDSIINCLDVYVKNIKPNEFDDCIETFTLMVIDSQLKIIGGVRFNEENISEECYENLKFFNLTLYAKLKKDYLQRVKENEAKD